MKGEKITISKGIIILIAYSAMIQFLGFFIASVIVLVIMGLNAYLVYRDKKMESTLNNQNKLSQKNEPEGVKEKSRKTLDQYIGINGLGIIAIVSVILGGDLGQTLKPIGTVAGILAIYYLVKKRKELKANQKWIGWMLIVVWVAFFSVASGSFANNQ